MTSSHYNDPSAREDGAWQKRYATSMREPPRHQNRLIHETSPYLLQHAHNPVDWQPWSADALEQARRDDKPILLSIGYAACHWCHVMERESFEDEATATLMNESFVCIKVDREERPDLDEIYMAATVAMSGSGGWPMTVFLTPDQMPFFAGTYFPPEDRYGRPGFKTLLTRIAALWKTERTALRAQAEELTRHVEEQAQATARGSIPAGALDAAEEQLAKSYDRKWGGFGRAPKFPPAQSLRLLLRQAKRTGAQRPLQMVTGTLDGMMNGGMRDHIGGGFHRYSTDGEWLVPHFEKMLYDNALLALAYTEAHCATGNPAYERIARETLDYVLREMTSPDGAFFSATDADSEGVEGKFFVWTPDELAAILPPEQASAFCAFYDVTPQGNWEGHSILRTPRAATDVARELGLTDERLEAVLSAAREKLYHARKEREHPLLDDKILTSWNALMIGALAECGRMLHEPRYVSAAVRAADFVLTAMRRPDQGLYRTSRAGKTHLLAYLEDYAFLCDALVDCYEASREQRFVTAAREIADRMIADFHDSGSGSFFQTAHDHESLIVRSREGQDGAIPSANAVAARALVRLSWHFGVDRYRELATMAIGAYGRLIDRVPRAFATSLMVADMLLAGPTEVVLAGDPADERTRSLAREAGRTLLPSRILVHLVPGSACHAPEALISGKETLGVPTLYVCRDFACKAPVTDPGQVARALDGDRAVAVSQRRSIV